MTNEFDDGTMTDLLGRPVVSYSQLNDSSWITVHPNGQGTKGVPVRISENGTIEAGMGGKHNGKKLSELGRKGLTSSSSGTNIKSEGNNKPTGVPKMTTHTFKSKSGTSVNLITGKNGETEAVVNGKNLGSVSPNSSKEHGYHLRAGNVAITVDPKYTEGVKSFIYSNKSEHFNANLSEEVVKNRKNLEQSKKDYDEYIRKYNKVINASYGSK